MYINTAVWIVTSLFACIGLVELFSWWVRAVRRPKGMRRGYRVIPLYEDSVRLERQIGYVFSEMDWGGRAGELVLLVDMGLSAAARQTCESLVGQALGVFLCTREELTDTIRQLDDLQAG